MKGYYVTLRDGGRTAWLLGPFQDHAKCKAAVVETVALANLIDARVWFMTHGTASIESNKFLPPGKLNSRLPHLLEPKES